MLNARTARKSYDSDGPISDPFLQSRLFDIDAYAFASSTTAASTATSANITTSAGATSFGPAPTSVASYGETGATSTGAGQTSSVSNLSSNSTVAIGVARDSYIARPSGLYNMAAMFQVNAGAANAPASLQLTVYDREKYAGAETHNFGTMTATNGATYRAAGYTVTFTNVNGQYLTANGLSLADFTFSASTQEDRLSNFNLTAYSSTGALVGSRNVSIVTHATTKDLSTGVSTASEIAAVAQSYIGKTWDSSGCWTLACDISATAGSSLAFNSGWITSAIDGNGQSGVAYNAYNGINANWMTTLKAGDTIEFGWKYANFGHIVTVDRVVNGVAYIVDNSGGLSGGDPTDLKIVERKLSDYAANIDQTTVVVFRDTGIESVVSNLGPTTDVAAFTNLSAGKSIAVSTLFAASDPDYDAITQYRVMDMSCNGGYFALNGVRQTSGTWTTVTADQLSGLTYTAASSGSRSETLAIQAYDGKSWGNIDTGRVVSLWEQANQKDEQTFRNLGVIDKANATTNATEWVGSTDKYDWWTFSISSTPTAVDIQLSNLTAQANMLVFDSKGTLVGSVYGNAFNNTAAKLTGTLGVGTYTVRIDAYNGATDYDLTIGKAGTLPKVMSGGTSTSIYGVNTLRPTSAADQAFASPGRDAFSMFGGAAPSLSLADALGLGERSGHVNLMPVADNQNDRGLLLMRTA